MKLLVEKINWNEKRKEYSIKEHSRVKRGIPWNTCCQSIFIQIVRDSGGEFIQDSAEVLQSHCIQEQPDGWKVANLMSLFKIGSGNTSGNYRPFSFDSFVAGGRGLKKHFRRLNGDI